MWIAEPIPTPASTYPQMRRTMSRASIGPRGVSSAVPGSDTGLAEGWVKDAETRIGIAPRRFPALAARLAILATVAVTVSGCGALHGARMVIPRLSGLDEVSPNLYVEPSMSAAQRQALQHEIELGRVAVEAFWGGITTIPYFVACVTADCDVRFGSYGQRAAAYGDIAIRLSPRGMTASLIAHEWSHAELYRRSGGWWHARRIPRWFDEGVAVVLANEPRHSEENWAEVRRLALPTPSLASLVTFGEWGAAMRTFGETAGDVPGNRHVVYTLAGHTVRAFLACAGSGGVVAVLDAVRAGATFDEAYARVGGGCVRPRE